MIVPRQYVSLKPTKKVRSPRRDAGAGIRSDAPHTGADLRAAREHLGWALPDVAAMLRIRPVYLEALEAGRLRQLPGKVYARGFLRSYAAALGLDAEQVAERYWAEAGDVAKRGDPLFFNPVLRHRVSTTVALLIAVLAVGTGWLVWSGWNDSDSDTMMPVPPPQASLVDRPTPGRDSQPPPSAAPAPSPEGFERRSGSGKPAPGTNVAQTRPAKPGAPGNGPSAGDTENLLLEPDGTAQPPQASNTGAGTAGSASAPAPSPQPPGQTPGVAVGPSGPASGGHPEPPGAPAPNSTPADRARIVLHFTADTWVQIKEPGGRVLLMKIMKAGQNYEVPDRQDLTMTTGNAGGIEIVVDGTTLPPLGSAGTIRKDVSLDPDRLKSAPSLSRR